MSALSSDLHYKKLILAILAFLIGINLRPVMAAIGPLVGIMQDTITISSTEMSLLTTLPVMMMGICALTGPWLRQAVGEIKGISLGLTALIIANIVRFFFQTPEILIATAMLAGVGIAFIQVLMPSYLKHISPADTGTLMGIFTTGIMAGAALSASISVAVVNSAGLHVALSIAAAPALIGLLIWLCFNQQQTINKAQTLSLPVFNKQAWLLMCFFGIGTGAYTLVLAWLPPYYIELGWPANIAGYLLGGLTLTEVIAGFIVAAIISKINDRRVILIVVILLLLAGLLCLVNAPLTLATPAMIILGLGIGALFPLSLIVTLDHAKTPSDAAALLAFVQGGGYLIAATMPFIAGILRDYVASLRSAWLIMIAGSVVLLLICLRFKPVKK